MSIIKTNQPSPIFGDLKSFQAKPQVWNKFHRNAPADAVYIGRGSRWGNPFVIGKDGEREGVIKLFELHCLPGLDVTPLKGKHLLCFCKPLACHGDLLLAKANE